MPGAKRRDAGGAVIVVIPLIGRMSVAGYDADDELDNVSEAVAALRWVAGRVPEEGTPECSFIGHEPPADLDLARMGLMLLVSAAARKDTREINVWMTALSTLMTIMHYSVRVKMYVDAAPTYEVHPIKARRQDDVYAEGREIVETMTGQSLDTMERRARLH